MGHSKATMLTALIERMNEEQQIAFKMAVVRQSVKYGEDALAWELETDRLFVTWFKALDIVRAWLDNPDPATTQWVAGWAKEVASSSHIGKFLFAVDHAVYAVLRDAKGAAAEAQSAAYYAGGGQHLPESAEWYENASKASDEAIDWQISTAETILSETSP